MTDSDRYVRALDAERDAWKELKLNLPGSPSFDQRKWASWQAALHEVAELIEARRGNGRQSSAERTPRAR